MTRTRTMDKRIGKPKNTKDKRKLETIRVGTWNVRGTNEDGAIRNLVELMGKYSLDILALQETKQREEGINSVQDCSFFNGGGKSRYLGVGFLVNKEWKKSVLGFESFTERICKIRFRARYRKITIVNVHAPTEDKDLGEKVEFYEKLGEIWEKIPNYDIKILIGDMNAKIGKEKIYNSVTGGKSKHVESNENGRVLIQFAEEKSLKIKSTAFDHKDIHKETWISPDGKTRNQIDHLLIESKHQQEIQDVRSFRGADANSDHVLVIAKLKQEIPTVTGRTGSARPKYNLEKLLSEETRQKIEEEFNTQLERQECEEDIQREWDAIEQSTQQVLKFIGKKKANKNKDWFTTECKEMLKKRNEARLLLLRKSNQENKSAYETARKKTKQICRQEKRRHMEEKMISIEQNYKNREIRNFYQGTKNMRDSGKKAPLYLKNKNGDLIGSSEGKLSRWMEHFDEVLNGENDQEHDEIEEVNKDEQTIIREPTDREIEEECKKLKNNRSCGENGIPAEILKHVGGNYKQRLCALIRKIWSMEQMPQQWKCALICPIPKKGDRRECENYRGISLLDVSYKLIARVIRNRLRTYHNRLVGEYQGGFREGRSTTDQIFTLKMIQSQAYEQNLSLHVLFVDFMKAYDSVDRSKLYHAMRCLEIPEKLIRLVKMTLNETINKVAAEGRTSEGFRVVKGVRQGDPLSTILFNLVLEAAFRDTGIPTEGIVYQRKQQIIAYADDIALITRSKRELESVFSKLERATRRYGLKINEEKTKYLVMKEGLGKERVFGKFPTDAKVYNFEKVMSFEYLGVTVTHNNDEDKEIEKRLSRGSRAVGSLRRLLKSKEVSRAAKIRMYRTIIRPTVVYGCETWIMTKKNENRLAVWERKILRGIFGGVKTEEGLWRQRSNNEIQELYGQSTISQYVKAQRLRWLGHVCRMSETRHSKRALEEGEGGKKRRGRPKKKWLEAVKEDAEGLGVTDWKGMTQNRPAWKGLVTRMEEERNGF